MKAAGRWMALLTLASGVGAHASDACLRAPLAAAAQVTVSDGTGFEVETLQLAADHAVIAQVRGGSVSVSAVEGPFAWVSDGSEAREGNDFTRRFALGHQFHAWWLHFDARAAGPVRETSVPFGGAPRAAREGGFPNGGTVALVAGDEPGRPRGLRLAFPGDLVIEAAFSDWRGEGGRALPWRIAIDDGRRVFTYRYHVLEFGAAAEAWWSGRPQADWGTAEVGIHRLHRALLAAHCDGDADRLAALSAPGARYLGPGRLDAVEPADVRRRFAGVFERLDYRSYEDLAPPLVEVSTSGDLGWAMVEVRARGVARASGEPFDESWAWVMLARKVDGSWRNAGIAATRR